MSEPIEATQTHYAQAAIFIMLLVEFIAFSCGTIHVPANAEDAKFFYMLFGIFNSMLSVKAFTTRKETP